MAHARRAQSRQGPGTETPPESSACHGLPAKYKWLRRGAGIFFSVVFSAKYLVLGIYVYMRILAGRWVSQILYHSSGFQLRAQSSTW